MTISIQDTTFAGKILNQIELEFISENVTVKDIISQRVQHEVARYNQKKDDYFNGLVQPTEAEQTLNGYKLKHKKEIDAEKQVYVALDAFQQNGYFVLINDLQAESLDQEVLLQSDTQISFLKLTPLVGG